MASLTFRQELEERDLVEVAKRICAPLHMRLEELRRDGALHVSPGITAGRRAFMAHLLEAGWSLMGIARFLGFEGHSSIKHILGTSPRQNKKKLTDTTGS